MNGCSRATGGVIAPIWPVRPIEWRTVAEPGYLVSVFAVLISAVVAAELLTRLDEVAASFAATPTVSTG